MDDAFGVHVKDSLHDLVGKVLDVVCVHLLGVVPDHVHQVLSAVLGDQVERLEVLRITGPHDARELHDVLVSFQDSEEADFAQNAVGVNVILEDVLDLLDGNYLVLALSVDGLGTVLFIAV